MSYIRNRHLVTRGFSTETLLLNRHCCLKKDADRLFETISSEPTLYHQTEKNKPLPLPNGGYDAVDNIFVGQLKQLKLLQLHCCQNYRKHDCAVFTEDDDQCGLMMIQNVGWFRRYQEQPRTYGHKYNAGPLELPCA